MQDSSKLNMMMSQKTMEINPRHPIVAELNKRIKDNPQDEVRPPPHQQQHQEEIRHSRAVWLGRCLCRHRSP